jgi:osmotically-inducible protein OsmY
MKKLFTLVALGSVALVSADQYNQSYGNGACNGPSCNNGGGYYQDHSYNGNYNQQNQRQNSQGYYQDQSNNSNYNQQNQRQNSQGYYQQNDQNYQRNNQSDYQQQPRNQSYNQNNQNQQYQQQGNQSYNRDQHRNYDNSSGNQNGNIQRMPSDQEINKKIQDTIGSGWFSKGFQNVSFDVNNGNVNLRGSVDTLENKNKIEDSVKKIDGVRQVNNQISIVKENPDAYSESQLQNSEKKFPQDTASNAEDRQLNAKIRDKLNNGWFSNGYEALVIRTTNGVVIISGSVDKPEDTQKIGNQIENIEGVKSVNNQLTVKNQ